MWRARHGAVPAPIVQVPRPRAPASPKDWMPSGVLAYPAEVVIGGPVAKTTRVETVYHEGYPVKVTTAMKDTMEAKDWALEVRVCCQPRDTLPSYTRLHRLLVALLGIQIQVHAPLHAQLWDNHQHVSLGQLRSAGVWVPTIVWLSEWTHTTGGRILAMGPGIAGPLGHSHHGAAAVAVDSHRSGCGGEVPIPRGVYGAQVHRAPE